MSLLELLIISIFCFFQSVFGVGLLLLGTPTFLLIGYNFFEVLNILLPYSILISFLQIISVKNKNFEFSRKIIQFSIPLLILGLITIEYFQNKINFIFVISIVLILFSIINIINLKEQKFKLKNINLALMFLGIIHGLTNLGGTLLSILASNLNKDKNIIRYQIASGYFIFAVFQLFFINIFYEKINFIYLKFIWIPILIFFISQKIFKKIKNILFYKLLNLFALIYGIYIFINSLMLH
ncbi:MAG: hypothetical protein CMI95_00015 [Pelagibacteraceae bacterium]|nr:hypothetical protein [Pelagibacteraceae bacterium]PPR50635.1 MAG: hypothetical protein CFH20_00879 [Alphaproteobacteria bacterium MarineAlpha5_Bin10]|tara:strand:- start:1657 stop:2373 length:717 start_codon:yes stop_codon:yes gene_type:complete